MDQLNLHKESALEAAENLTYKELSDILERKLEAQLSQGKILARALLNFTKNLTMNDWSDVKLFTNLKHVDLAIQMITTVNMEDTSWNYVDQSPVNEHKRKRDD